MRIILVAYHVIAIKPDDADAHNNRGNALQTAGRLAESIANYDRAIGIKSDHAQAYNNRGISLDKLNRADELEWSMNGMSTKAKVKVTATDLELTDNANRTIKYKRK